MGSYKKFVLASIVASSIFGCATVRQQDLNSWVGVPVEALDTHSIFNSMSMTRRVAESGLEIRNYANGSTITSCFNSGSAKASGNKAAYTGNTFCGTNENVCNNIFYIKGGRVIEYAPTGNCFTDERAQPGRRWRASVEAK